MRTFGRGAPRTPNNVSHQTVGSVRVEARIPKLGQECRARPSPPAPAPAVAPAAIAPAVAVPVIGAGVVVVGTGRVDDGRSGPVAGRDRLEIIIRPEARR